jgi:hypothetical protein
MEEVPGAISVVGVNLGEPSLRYSGVSQQFRTNGCDFSKDAVYVRACQARPVVCGFCAHGHLLRSS